MNKEELKQAIEAAQAAKDYQTAEGIAKDAIGSFPDDSFGYLHLAETLLLANDEPLDPSNIKHLVSFASAKSRKGEYAVAQFFWDKILQIDPQNITAFAAKGWYELNIAEDYSKAVPLFNRVIKYDENSIKTYFYRAEAYLKLERYPKALKDYNYAIKLQDDIEYIDNLHFKMQIVTALGNEKMIAATHKAILALEPNNLVNHIQYAQFLISVDRYKEAATAYATALNLANHDRASIAYAWSNTLRKSQQYEKALEALDIYIQYSSNDKQAQLGLLEQIALYLEINQYDAALQSIERIQKNNPDAKTSHQLTILRAEMSIKLEAYQEALDILAPLRADAFNQGAVLYTYGKALFFLGDLEQAYHSLRNAVMEGNNDANDFINAHFQDYLYNTQAEVIEILGSIIDKNKQSKFIHNVKGKIWCLSHLKGGELYKWEEKKKADFQKKVSSTMLFLTERGILKIGPQYGTLAIYKILSETANVLTVQMRSLDKASQEDLTLSLTEDGLIECNIYENQAVVLKEVLPKNLAHSIKRNIRAFNQPRNLALLGPATTRLIKAIWA